MGNKPVYGARKQDRDGRADIEETGDADAATVRLGDLLDETEAEARAAMAALDAARAPIEPLEKMLHLGGLHARPFIPHPERQPFPLLAGR